jgi:hypothetical protein
VHEDPNCRGVLSVFGSQEEARRCEDNISQSLKNVHAVEENSEEAEGVDNAEAPEVNEGVKQAEHTKKVPLCEDVPDRTVIIGKGLEPAEEERLVHVSEEQLGCFCLVFG